MSAAGGDRAPIEVDGRLARRLDAVRAAIAVILGLLAILALVSLLDGPPSLRELVAAGLVAALGLVLLAHRRTTKALADRRRSREASMTRILQGLSRSLSPDSVVEAIVQELRTATGADHVVVARVRQPDHVVEVTLASANPLVPASRTLLRPEVPELSTDRAAPLATDGPPRPPEVAHPPAGGSRGSPSEPAPDRVEAMERSVAEVEPFAAGPASQAAAEEIARRVRSAYGLTFTLAQALVAEHRFLGAIVLSKRTRDAWSGADRRILGWAAGEVAAAFARAYVLEEAERGANLDALTGLPNRRYFDELVAIVRPGRRSTDSLGILMVDIDRFKGLNDRYGHAAGDSVLRAVAGAIATTIRAEDTPARYGGEEFAVILRRASAPQAAEVGERVRVAVSGLAGEDLGLAAPVTVSVGVAVAHDDEEVVAVIERADKALYRAKRRGRDRVEVG